MQDILSDKFYQFIDAIETNDTHKIAGMTEKRFGDKIVNNMEKIGKNEFKFEQLKSDNSQM